MNDRKSAVIRRFLSGAAVILVTLIVNASPAHADADGSSAPQSVPNFRFTDVDGVEHELYDLASAKAVVLFFQMNGCPIVRQSYPYFEEINAQFANRGVKFLYINTNKWDTPEAVIAERKDYQFTPPVLIDRQQALARYLGVERSADTFVIDPDQNWRVVYHGMADDRFDYGLQRMSPEKFWLRDALDAIVAGKEPEHTETVAKGCLLDMDTVHGVEFDKHVQPILANELSSLLDGAPTEPAAKAASDEILSTLLTRRDPSGNPVTLTDGQAEILIAWLFRK
jgi:peroxiredoxin